MSVYYKLQFLYPTMTDEDVILMYQNGRDTIVKWNEAKLGPQPSETVIDAVKDKDATDAEKNKKAAFLLADSAIVKALAVVIANNVGKTEAQILTEIEAALKTKVKA